MNHICTGAGCSYCLAVENEELKSQKSALITALRDARIMCNRAMSIAQRDGKDTNWQAWRNQLGASIFQQTQTLQTIQK